MPLLFQRNIHNVRYAVWRIEENIAFFIENLPPNFLQTHEEYSQITHPKIKIQWLASRYLWYKMTAEPASFCIEKSIFGKPYLQNAALQYSISHSENFVAIAEAALPCGIDIQVPTGTIDKIAHRIMHESDWQELEKNKLDTTLFWSAKEAIFKAWEKGNLAGKNIRLHDFKEVSEARGSVIVEERKQKRYFIFYEKNLDFTIVLAVEEEDL